jgi:DNA polymerase V
MTDFFHVNRSGLPGIPLYSSRIHAGFPSPADDFLETVLDLGELVMQTPGATFYVRVTGDSMKDAGIQAGDVIVVDRSITPTNNAIIVARLNNEFTIKYLLKQGEAVSLLPANTRYQPITITEEMDFQVWGVVTAVVHLFVPRRI